ncbi:MAG: hypothetical protein JWO82_16, partial [Akkermansiaceae bacterium]|nr:hypothetical protein [Akkermansiaceae bacterium]
MKTTTLLVTAAMVMMMTGLARAEPIGVGAPLEVNLQIHQGAVALDFDTAAEKYYQIEFSQDLVTWDREGYSFKGTGGRMSKVASGRGLARGYYRLRDDGDPQNVATG